MISALFLIAGIRSTETYKLINKQIISLTQQIHSLPLQNLLMENVTPLLVYVPFHMT